MLTVLIKKEIVVTSNKGTVYNIEIYTSMFKNEIVEIYYVDPESFTMRFLTVQLYKSPESSTES